MLASERAKAQRSAGQEFPLYRGEAGDARYCSSSIHLSLVRPYALSVG